MADAPESHADHVVRRPLAWRKLEFRHLGRLSRTAALHRTNRLGTQRTHRHRAHSVSHPDLPAGHHRLGLLPSKNADRGALRHRPDVHRTNSKSLAAEPLAVASGNNL